MTYYVEHLKAVQALDAFLKKGKYCIRFLAIFSGVLSGLIPLDALMRHMEPTDIMAAIVAAAILFGIFGVLLNYVLLGGVLWRAKKRFGSQITLSNTKIVLTDGFGKIIKQVSYQEIECVEIQCMYSTTTIAKAKNRAYSRHFDRHTEKTDELIPFICLYTKYIKIPCDSHRKEYYSKVNNVLLFPYQESAWDLLSKQLPDKIISNTELQPSNIV